MNTNIENHTTRSKISDDILDSNGKSSIDEERNKGNNSDEINIILNYGDMIHFMSSSMCCRMCKSGVDETCFHKTTCGFASSIFYKCRKCGYQNNILPKMAKDRQPLFDFIDDDVEEKSSLPNIDNKKSYSAYDINVHLLCWIQQFGLSGAAARQLASALQITDGTRLFGSFTSLEEAIGLYEIILSKMIIDDNVREELAMSPVDEFGRSLSTSTMDGGWNHRGSGRLYDSDSCQHVMFGAYTKKIIALYVMSRVCAKCAVDKIHPLILCPRNYIGSSKGMEAHGASINVNWLYERFNCIVDTIIMDDDSSSKNVLKCKYADRQEEARKRGEVYAWPKYKSGGKRRDTGTLPLEHGDVNFKADINHRLRAKSKKEYALANGPKYKSECTKVDAARLKRNMSRAVFQNRSKPFHKLKRSSIAALEHLFDDHRWCDASWCRYLQQKKRELDMNGGKNNASKDMDKEENDAREDNKIEGNDVDGNEDNEVNVVDENNDKEGNIAHENNDDEQKNKKQNKEEKIKDKKDDNDTDKKKDGKGKVDNENENYYRSKETHKILYGQLKTLHDLYVSDESLRDMHHSFDTNKNECFNKLVTKFVPKTSYLCGSVAGKARVYVAAGIDSVGYVSFYSALYSILGVEYTTPIFRQHAALDNDRAYRTKYFRDPDNRKKKAERLAERIKKLMEDTKKDKRKGKTYRKNMAGPCLPRDDDDGKVSDQEEKMKASTKNAMSYCMPCNQDKEEADSDMGMDVDKSMDTDNVIIESSSRKNQKGKGKKENTLSAKNNKKCGSVTKKKRTIKNPTTKVKCQKNFVCATCHQPGHARNTHKECKFSTNKNSKYYGKSLCVSRIEFIVLKVMFPISNCF